LCPTGAPSLESIREGKRIRKRTIANLSALTLEQAEAIRCVLKGEGLAPAGRLECIRSLAHGHGEAVLTAMRRLGFEKLIHGKPSRERDLVVAMVAGRIIAPEASKLAMTQAWADTTLAEELGVADAHEDELYAAMDWLIERQDKIEKRLANRHLKEGGLVLFDLTSSSFEGVTCPLARIGYSRDGKPGTRAESITACSRTPAAAPSRPPCSRAIRPIPRRFCLRLRRCAMPLASPR
jgi:hypothetical protein